MEADTDDLWQIGFHRQGVGLRAVHVAADQALPKTGVRRFDSPHRAVFCNSIFGPRGVPDGPDGRSGADEKFSNQTLLSDHVQRVRSHVCRGQTRRYRRLLFAYVRKTFFV